MADPLEAYRWLDHEMAGLKGVLEQVVDRLRDAPTHPRVRAIESEILARHLADCVSRIDDCLSQARQEALDIRHPFSTPDEFFTQPRPRKGTAVPISSKEQAG